MAGISIVACNIMYGDGVQKILRTIGHYYTSQISL